MMNDYIEEEITVHPLHGMQLSEGYIRKDNSKGFLGCLPGLVPYAGKTMEEVRLRLEQEAKEYYGDDVVVEIAPHALAS
jgi:hypothetical protein